MSPLRLTFVRGCCVSVACAALVLLALLLPPDGATTAAWLRGIGRLHVLVLHLPIAFILLVPLLDAGGRWLRRDAWCETADLVLGLAFVGATGAAVLGILLAHGDGHQGAAVRWHLWAGLAAAMLTGVVWALRPVAPQWRIPAGLAAAALVGWAAHLGGSLTHGEQYLTSAWSDPAAVQAVPTAPASTISSVTVWQVAILPMMERSCTACHGPTKTNAGLRLDTPEGWRLGGKSDLPCVTPGKVEGNELLRRIVLPVDDDDVMPPDGKPLLKPDEIALLRWWMATGADFTVTVASVQATVPADIRHLLLPAVPAVTAKQQAPVAPSPTVDGSWTVRWTEFQALAQRAGLTLAPVSTVPGDGLALRGFDGGAAVTSVSLVPLAPLSPFLVDADLAGTAVDDAGLETIATWTSLRRCDLSRTRISGAGLVRLAALPHLACLLLNGTAVDDAAVAILRSCRHLHRLGLCQTRVTPAVVQSLTTSLPLCAVGSDVAGP